MQIICIYSGVSNYQHKLDYIFNIFKSTLDELGINISIVDVSKLNINFFNGTKVPIIENIFNNIKNSNGVIFATTAQRLAPNGAMQNFIEHMDTNLYGDILNGKTCISIVTSMDNSEYMAGNYMNALIASLLGTPSGMFIGKEYLTNIEMSIATTQMIERYAEDFYRAVKQNRKYFVSTPFKDTSKLIQNNFNSQENEYKAKQPINAASANINQNEYINQNSNIENSKKITSLTGSQVASLYQKETYNNMYSNNNGNMSDLAGYFNNQANTEAQNFNQYSNSNQAKNSINYNNIYAEQSNFNPDLVQQRNYEPSKVSDKIQEFNSLQKDDISELTKLLSQKYKEENERNNNLNQYMNNSYKSNSYTENITPSISTLKQKTQMLYHYFQPHLARGIVLTIQISINGKENFEGYFTINNGECTYTDGVNASADVSVISDSSVWADVLDGKSTLQKAFMLGRLKVKGNFVMISKFEQFFKIS